jgi:hypothetical protein
MCLPEEAHRGTARRDTPDPGIRRKAETTRKDIGSRLTAAAPIQARPSYGPDSTHPPNTLALIAVFIVVGLAAAHPLGTSLAALVWAYTAWTYRRWWYRTRRERF